MSSKLVFMLKKLYKEKRKAKGNLTKLFKNHFSTIIVGCILYDGRNYNINLR